MSSFGRLRGGNFRRSPPSSKATPNILLPSNAGSGVSGGRFRRGSFNRGREAFSPRNTVIRRPGQSPIPTGIGVGDVIGTVDRVLDVWDQFQSAREGLGQDSIVPDWLVPTGIPGLYMSPNEAVDPWDCDRYSNSPYCGGAAVDPLDFATFTPLGVAPIFATNRDFSEACVSINTNLFGVPLPTLDFCYRAPWSRPRLPEPEAPTIAPPTQGEGYWIPFSESRTLSLDCSYDVLVNFVSLIKADGSYEYITRNPQRCNGRPVGLYAERLFPPRSRWRATLYGQNRERFFVYGVLEWGVTVQGVWDEERLDALFWAIPPPYILTITFAPGNLEQVCRIPEYFTPPPHPSPTRNNMSCCAETEELLRLIARRIGTDSYPIKIPKWLMTKDEEDEEHQSLTELNVWLIKQIDGLFGQFPIDIEIEDIDPVTEENQSQTVTLPNLAETLAELYGLAVKNSVNGDLSINFLTRLASEIIATKNAAIVTQDYARANASFLGYKGNPKAREIKYSFDGENPDSLEKLLKDSKKKVIGWKNEDSETVVDFLQKIVFSAGIIKAVFMRRRDQAEDIVNQIRDLTDPNSPEQERQNDRWKEFIEQLNDKQSEFNKESITYPVVVDISEEDRTRNGNGNGTPSGGS